MEPYCRDKLQGKITTSRDYFYGKVHSDWHSREGMDPSLRSGLRENQLPIARMSEMSETKTVRLTEQVKAAG
jgi:hypothetical protein